MTTATAEATQQHEAAPLVIVVAVACSLCRPLPLRRVRRRLPHQRGFISIATGGTGGVYYP